MGSGSVEVWILNLKYLRGQDQDRRELDMDLGGSSLVYGFKISSYKHAPVMSIALNFHIYTIRPRW